MKSHFWIWLLLGVAFMGCSSLFKSTKTEMPIEVSSTYINSTKIYKEESSNSPYLLVGGNVQQPFGKNLERANAVISFFDETDRKIVEEYTKINFIRRRMGKKISGKFTLKTPYLQTMKKCKIDLAWK